MNPAVRSAVERSLNAAVVRSRRLSGGDINDAFAVSLDDGREVFVKTHPRPPTGMFEAEAKGLQWLNDANAIRVPRVIAYAEGEAPFLALEMLVSARRATDFGAQLGRQLAELHATGAPSFGLDHDNFIGRLPQHNAPASTWVEFYWERRIEPQLRMAVDRGLLDAKTSTRCLELERVLSDRVGPSEPAARLHGDLWGGNLHIDDKGQPCLIDPAVYGGHREVDLAMMRLFGGFDESVFAAYEEAAPLAPDAKERVPLYQLYPLLVHVNLFGGSYVGSVANALERVV